MNARHVCYLIAVFFWGLGFYFAWTVVDITPAITCWLAGLFSFFLGEISDDGELRP